MVLFANDSNLILTEIKRKIPANKVVALTVSKVGTEFVIHVPEEYDYRYASFDKFIKCSFIYKLGGTEFYN